MTPFTLAAQLGIPVVDADMMGRAFPELQMCLPSLYGVAATPMAMADEKGNSVVIKTVSNRWTERIARSVTIDMGCSAMIALYAMTGRAGEGDDDPPDAAPGGGHRARRPRDAREAHGDVVGAVTERIEGFRLFEGKIVDIARRTESGFAKATARVEGTGAHAGTTLELDVQNEHLVATLDGEIVASVPDLIIMLDSETGEPITTEDMRYGFRVDGDRGAVRPPLARARRRSRSSARATSATTSTTCRSRSARRARSARPRGPQGSRSARARRRSDHFRPRAVPGRSRRDSSRRFLNRARSLSRR